MGCTDHDFDPFEKPPKPQRFTHSRKKTEHRYVMLEVCPTCDGHGSGWPLKEDGTQGSWEQCRTCHGLRVFVPGRV